MPAANVLVAAFLFLVALLVRLQFEDIPTCGALLIFLVAVGLAAGICSIAMASMVVALSIAATISLVGESWPGEQGDVPLVGMFILVSAIVVAVPAALHRLWREAELAYRDAAGRLDTQHLYNRELQHRLVNNLQMVASLLMLEGRGLDGSARAVLDRAVQRLGVLGRLHDRFGLEEGVPVDAAPLLDAVARDLVDCAAVPGISCTVRADPLRLTGERMLPLSMILTELLTNALKHAFPNGRSGAIAVRLARHDDRLAVLEVRDDGVGMAVGADSRPDGRLGLDILRALASQIDGELSFSGGSGTVARLSFPLTPAAR